MALFDFDGLEDAAAAAQQGGRWLALQPTGDVASRLCAVASAELLAADTGRELVVRWAPEIACDAPWRQLFRPEHGPRQLLGGCHGHRSWSPPSGLRTSCSAGGTSDRACRSEPHPELRGPAVERFGQCHRLHLHAELAALGLGSVEFQVMEDRDWGRSFFPMSDEPGALIMGPSGWQGGSWWTEIPKGCRLLHVVWDLRGSRSLEWTFFGRNGRPLKPPVLEGPFFLAGSWNSWQEFAEFVPQAGDGPPYVASVEVGPGWKKERFEEFNILQGQDWGRCFYPARAGSKKIHGPVDGSWAPVWRVRVAPACMRLQVVWDPRGARSVGWRLLGQTGEEVSTAPPQRWTPKKIGGWRISGELGRGWAGGVVYTAEWEG
ncbi:unnamed protein product, partial [Prorocentrum cordatum]